MIKVIKESKKLVMPKQEYRITCSECGSIFTCDEDDCFTRPACQGFVCNAITCPVCGETVTDYMNPNWKISNLAQLRAIQQAIWDQEDNA